MAAAASPLLRVDFGPAPAPPSANFAPLDIPPAQAAGQLQLILSGLAGYIQTCFRGAADNRRNLGVDDRMMAAMRALRGEYDGATLRDIRQFGGSEVYARITASKVRACAALLREIYTATERPWALSPTPEPELAGPTLQDAVRTVLEAEAAELMAAGTVPEVAQLKQRAAVLKDELLQMRKKAADVALQTRTSVIDDVLWEGGFYEALWAMLGDIATFPFGVLKGPIVRMKNVLVWDKGIPTTQSKPVPVWERCSPFDVYFAPWSQHPQDGYIVHRERVSRAAVQSLRGLPNYSTAAIDNILANWNHKSAEWYDYNETERAMLEQRESQIAPIYGGDGNERPMPMLSFYGSVSGKMLRDWGMDEAKVPDESKDVNVFAYLIGGEVIGVTMNPHPTGRLPFYGDSFERVPGSCYGNAIPDLIDDIQSVGNAALRAMVNNLAIASGPMGWINEDRLAENDPNAAKLWPWKIFRFTDRMTAGSTEEPMKFFQPTANVQELLTVYNQMLTMADEISTIPRYMQGSGMGAGGAGRTASGLSMLMEASNRTIKQTVSSIDQNVIESVVEDLNVYLALTRPDVVMEGDISVIARGAVELMQRETLRMRRMEFLQITNNPIDQQLVGVEGRFKILKEIARDLGMPTADSMALSENQAEAISQMMIQQTMGQMAGGGAPPQPQGAGGGPTGVTPAAGGGKTPVVPPGPAPGTGGAPPGGPPPPPQG
jgi:hypothetical protein